MGDHRRRVARERRERMRERLIAATMDAYRKSAGKRRPVIDDVIRAANVSRGTFYKYFDTLDEVLAEIGRTTASEMLQSFERLFEPLDDGAVMLATGPLMALARAAMDPAHGAIVSHADLVDRINGDDPRRQLAFRSLNYGREQGVFQFDSIEAAFDLVIGTSVEGARRISRTGQLNGACIRETVVMILSAWALSSRRPGSPWPSPGSGSRMRPNTCIGGSQSRPPKPALFFSRNLYEHYTSL